MLEGDTSRGDQLGLEGSRVDLSEGDVSSELSRRGHKSIVIQTESRANRAKCPGKNSGGCFSARKWEFPELLTALEYTSRSHNPTAQAFKISR